MALLHIIVAGDDPASPRFAPMHRFGVSQLTQDRIRIGKLSLKEKIVVAGMDDFYWRQRFRITPPRASFRLTLNPNPAHL